MRLRPKLADTDHRRKAPDRDGHAPGHASDGQGGFFKRAAGSVNPGVPGVAGWSHAAQGRGAGPDQLPQGIKAAKKEPRPPVWLYVCPPVARHLKRLETADSTTCERAAKLLVRPNVSKTCHAAPHRVDSTFVPLRGYPAAARHCPIERFTDWAAVRPLPPCSIVVGTAAYKNRGRKGRNRKQLHSSPNSRLSQEHPYQLG